MFRPPNERWEVAFGEIVSCESGADGARAIVEDYRGVVEVVRHIWRWQGVGGSQLGIESSDEMAEREKVVSEGRWKCLRGGSMCIS